MLFDQTSPVLSVSVVDGGDIFLYTDMLTLWLNRPRGPFSEKYCPALDNQCLQDGVVYQATVKETKTNSTESFVGMKGDQLKERYWYRKENIFCTKIPRRFFVLNSECMTLKTSYHFGTLPTTLQNSSICHTPTLHQNNWTKNAISKCNL